MKVMMPLFHMVFCGALSLFAIKFSYGMNRESQENIIRLMELSPVPEVIADINNVLERNNPNSAQNKESVSSSLAGVNIFKWKTVNETHKYENFCYKRDKFFKGKYSIHLSLLKMKDQLLDRNSNIDDLVLLHAIKVIEKASDTKASDTLEYVIINITSEPCSVDEINLCKMVGVKFLTDFAYSSILNEKLTKSNKPFVPFYIKRGDTVKFIRTNETLESFIGKQFSSVRFFTNNEIYLLTIASIILAGSLYKYKYGIPKNPFSRMGYWGF